MASTSSLRSSFGSRPRRNTAVVIGLCWIAMFAEGYDMSSLGAVLPYMLNDAKWGLTGIGAGLLASAALGGMFFGGYGMGVLADRIGRKRAFLLAVTIYSLASVAAALAPTIELFAAARFICGIGVGGIVPICSALVYEFSRPESASQNYALMYSGYTIGIFAASLSAYSLAGIYGWRLVVGLGGLPVFLLPVFARFLPESIAFLMVKGRIKEADALARDFGVEVVRQAEVSPVKLDSQETGLRFLFGPKCRRATVGFWLATFFAMIVIYGLTTWLPQIMRSAGYELGPAILFLGVFALSSSVGGLILGWLADRFEPRLTILWAFLLGAAAIILMSHQWPLLVTYLIVALAGVGTTSAGVMITSYQSAYFPAHVRATAVCSCLSFSRFGAICGPLVGGFVMSNGLNMQWNFVAYAIAAFLAGVAIIVPAKPKPLN